MRDGTVQIAGRAKYVILAVAMAVLLLLSLQSARTLLAAYYYGRVPAVLDDRSSPDNITVSELSGESLPAYRETMRIIERASSIDPARSLYPKALADLNARIGNWVETMELLKAELPREAGTSKDTIASATASIRQAVRKHPTNPDSHLVYGHLARESNDTELARSEYEKAVKAYPWNSPLRYAVIMEYLAAGMAQEARVQAVELARVDDSYRLSEQEMKRGARETRALGYLSKLYDSYLFKALEIVWRTSGNDVQSVVRATPAGNEARDTVQLFLASKNIEE